MTHTNWIGNVTFGASEIHTPDTIEKLQEIVHRSHHVKAIGSKHSFSTIADTDQTLISLENLDKPVNIDTEAMTVTVEGGMIYSQLGKYLHEHGYAIHNLASLPHISIVGAVSTGTHGSGDNNGNLSTAVAALEFVDASGELVKLSRGDEAFNGAVVNLGGIGVICKITLDIEPTYDVQQYSYQNLPVPALTEHFEQIMSCAYSVSIWCNWTTDVLRGLLVKHRVDDASRDPMPDEFHGAQLETVFPGGIFTNRESPGPWHLRLPHFLPDRPLEGPVSEELQAEYFVARDDAVEAIERIYALSDQLAPLMGVTELRSMTADNLWMSPAYQRDTISIHFNMRPDEDAIFKLLPQVEETIMHLGARPHWGKLFTLSPDYVKAQYDRLDDFRALLETYDPNGKFRNDFLNQYIFDDL